MTKIALFRPGGRGRGAPRGLALAALTIIAFAQAGCSSFNGGCNSCGEGLGSRLRGCSLFSGNLLQHKWFNQSSSLGCEPGCDGGACGTPIQGGTVVPLPGPGPIMGSPSEEIDLSPAGIPSGPTTTTPPAGPTTSTPKTGTQASNGTRVFRPRTGASLARNVPAPRLNTTPEPASRPAAGAKSSTATDDVLADLPPIRPAIDRTDPIKSPPPPEAEAIAKPATTEAPAGASAASPVVDAKPPVASADAPPNSDAAAYFGAPGIRPFKSVSPELSGGGEPTAAGWEWLARNGAYKTVLDLREATVDHQAASAAANTNGLRYIQLPVSADKIDADLMKRFLEEISMASAKPVYFFDADGQRAATLWYIKLISVDKLTTQEALKQVADLGSPGSELLLASHKYLASLVAPTVVPENSAPKAASTTPEATTPPSDPGAQIPSAATSASIDEPSAESTPWKSYVALVMTGLGVPLAFFGRSAIRDHQHRASLPAPEKSPRSLPPASDV